MERKYDSLWSQMWRVGDNLILPFPVQFYFQGPTREPSWINPLKPASINQTRDQHYPWYPKPLFLSYCPKWQCKRSLLGWRGQETFDGHNRICHLCWVSWKEEPQASKPILHQPWFSSFSASWFSRSKDSTYQASPSWIHKKTQPSLTWFSYKWELHWWRQNKHQSSS